MVQPASHCPKAGFDVAKTLAIGELGEPHAQELIPCAEALALVVATIAIHALPELVHGNEVHDLGEYGSTSVHLSHLSADEQKRNEKPLDSNR
jgi:hypothetical protein